MVHSMLFLFRNNFLYHMICRLHNATLYKTATVYHDYDIIICVFINHLKTFFSKRSSVKN